MAKRTVAPARARATVGARKSRASAPKAKSRSSKPAVRKVRAPAGARAKPKDAPAIEPAHDFAGDIAWLTNEARALMAEVKASRLAAQDEPQSATDQERVARTIASLTTTIRRLESMRAANPETVHDDYDDVPTDLDAFRNELARRIRAIIASRRATDGPGEDTGEPSVEPAPEP